MCLCLSVCMCVKARELPTLWALWYATLLVSEVWARVSGEAPWSNGGVVWIPTVVFSEVLLPVPLWHESVRRQKATVTHTDTCTRPGCQKILASMHSNHTCKNAQGHRFCWLFYHWQNQESGTHFERAAARRWGLQPASVHNQWKLTTVTMEIQKDWTLEEGRKFDGDSWTLWRIHVQASLLFHEACSACSVNMVINLHMSHIFSTSGKHMTAATSCDDERGVVLQSNCVFPNNDEKTEFRSGLSVKWEMTSKLEREGLCNHNRGRKLSLIKMQFVLVHVCVCVSVISSFPMPVSWLITHTNRLAFISWPTETFTAVW